MAQINIPSLSSLPAQVTAFVRPWLLFAGVMLALCLALVMVGGFRVPFVSGGQEQLWLAALLIYAGR